MPRESACARRSLLLTSVLTVTATACSSSTPTEQAPASSPAAAPVDDRKYALDQVDDAAVAQLYADGFSSAAAEGEDARSGISTRRRWPDGTSSTTRSTSTRSRCAASSSRSSRIPRAWTQRRSTEIQRYTKLFWLNNGPYNNLTARKFVLKLHAGSLAAAAQRRRRSAAPRSRRRRGRIARRAC